MTARIHTTSSGQGHETLVSTVLGEVLEIDPSSIRITRPNSLESLPGNSPVGSRMAIMLGGAAAQAEKLKAKLIKIAAHSLAIDAEKLTYAGGNVLAPDGRKHTWQDAIELAHRQFHNLPEGMDPGLAAFDIMQVPTGNALPVDGKVHMYPCYSFEFHLVLLAFDPVIGRKKFILIRLGMIAALLSILQSSAQTYGGIAHGDWRCITRGVRL